MSLIGKIIAKKYSYRVEDLEEMKNALNIFKNKIKFTYSPIGEIFEEISQNTSIKNIANIFTQAKNNMNNQTASEAWDKSLEEINTNMKEEDIKKLKNLSKLLRKFRRRRTNKSNRTHRRIFRNSNTRSNTRKKKEWKIIPKARNNRRISYSNYFILERYKILSKK